MTGPQDEPFPFDDDQDGCWLSPSEMVTGRWVEIPVDEDGPPRWVRIEILLPPEVTLEYRWAVRVRRDGVQCWIKVAPWLCFRTAECDPTDPGGRGADGAAA